MIATPPAGLRERADRAVARGGRLDALIPRVLLDSPVTLVGYAWGTAVGWVWGTLWSTGRVERRAGLWVFTGMPSWTFGRGGVCVGGCYLTGSAPVTTPQPIADAAARVARAAGLTVSDPRAVRDGEAPDVLCTGTEDEVTHAVVRCVGTELDALAGGLVGVVCPGHLIGAVDRGLDREYP